MFPVPIQSTHRKHATRRGVVSVEFALTAPLFFLFVLAGIEFSRANMLVHTAVIAATEGARKGIVSGALSDECYEGANEELVAIGVNQASIAVFPETITDETDMITVGVRVPINLQNGYVTPQWFLGEQIVRTVSVTREAKNIDPNSNRGKQLNTQAAMDLINGGGRGAGKMKEKGRFKSGFFDFLRKLGKALGFGR